MTMSLDQKVSAVGTGPNELQDCAALTWRLLNWCCFRKNDPGRGSLKQEWVEDNSTSGPHAKVVTPVIAIANGQDNSIAGAQKRPWEEHPHGIRLSLGQKKN